MIEDVTVPLSKLPLAVKRAGEVKERSGLPMIVLGHAGNGNLHPIIGYDPENLDEAERAEKAFKAIREVAIELDGSVSGEHGIGIHKVEDFRRKLEAHGGASVIDFMRG